MIKWKCSICGIDAEYHLGKDGAHKYFCRKHWWEHVIQTSGMDDVRTVVCDGKGRIVDFGNVQGCSRMPY